MKRRRKKKYNYNKVWWCTVYLYITELAWLRVLFSRKRTPNENHTQSNRFDAAVSSIIPISQFIHWQTELQYNVTQWMRMRRNFQTQC